VRLTAISPEMWDLNSPYKVGWLPFQKKLELWGVLPSFFTKVLTMLPGRLVSNSWAQVSSHLSFLSTEITGVHTTPGLH
jgi:hypothetical protein